jgi:hypothetical protein
MCRSPADPSRCVQVSAPRILAGSSRAWCVLGACGLACGGALAQPATVGSGLVAGSASLGVVELERVDPLVDAPTASTARLYRVDASPVAAVSKELRTRWWLGGGGSGLGAGADWAATPVGAALRPWRPVLGLRAALTPQTRLLYEWRAPAAAPWAVDGLPGASQREVRVVMEFKSARNPAQSLRHGLFRVQLSNSSALWLKPRSGGLVVSYRAQF